MGTVTRRGRFRGRVVDAGVEAFLGIRYAEPPFGVRRFGAPVPVDFAGDCLEFGPVAPQSARLSGAPAWRPGDEDVLSLNVWVPSTSDGPWPVLFYVHGGAYTFGSSAQPEYDGAALARAGLVVVTCNYRLGFDGFGHVEGQPDNRGLLDQRAALRWVRENVEVFGGDPDNITVGGQSAGAASALFLAAWAPVRRVIAHSVPNRCYTTGFARRVAEWIDTGTPESAVTSADALVAAQRGGPLSYDPVLFGPVADALPALEVDALLCHTDVEYALFDAVGTFRPPADLRAFGRDWGIPDHVVAAYEHYGDAHVRLAGDFVFAEPTSRLAEANGRAFLARFGRPPAWHTADVPFSFGNVDGAGREDGFSLIGGPSGDDERALSRRMLRAWVDFCTTGDPGWTGVRHWGERVEARREPWRGVDLSAPVDYPVQPVT